MSEYRVSFDEIEDEVAKFTLYENEEPQEHLTYSIDNLPDGVELQQLNDQFCPEFDGAGNIVALHYDQEITDQKRRDFEEAAKKHDELLDDG
jgi:hypothetical protein